MTCTMCGAVPNPRADGWETVEVGHGMPPMHCCAGCLTYAESAWHEHRDIVLGTTAEQWAEARRLSDALDSVLAETT